MRKYLLAGVAVLGAATAMQGSAFAQPAPAPAMPLMQPPMNTLIVPNGGKSANDNNNYQPAPLPGAVATPTPGTMVIRLNGKIWTEWGWGGGDGMTVTNSTGTYKRSADAGIDSYVRLYPGFDAQATNGLRYGGQVEIRENFNGVGYTGVTSTNAQANTGATGTSGLTSAQTLYVRRDFTWVSMPQYGLVRIGQTDGVAGIFDNGVISQQGYGQGGWNGDASEAAPAAGQPAYPWYSQQGAEYGSNKIVYLSPQFFGVDLGLEYAPNNGNVAGGGCNANTLGCAPQTSSPVDPTGARFINQYQVGLRYQGVVGPVSIYAFGEYIGSGASSYSGTPLAAQISQGAPVGSKYTGKYNGLSAGFGGVELTIGGLAIGGGWQGGQYNGTMALEPKGGSGANLYGFGALYTIGALSFGASWYGFDTQGSVGLAGISQRHENAYGLGVNYTIAPGINPYLEALYGTVHQGDFNFITGANGSSAHNNAFSEALMIGIQVGW
jgi:hypothetical protein